MVRILRGALPRGRKALAGMVLAGLCLAAACSGSPTGPYTGGGGYGGGSGGGSGGDGGSGGGADPGPPPATAAVVIGNDFFRSGHNGTVNPAVDTVAVGGTVTWTWTNTGATGHSVQSLTSGGGPGFASSQIKTGNGSSYQVTFDAPGTYRYDCAVHGAAMPGVVVVR